MSENISVVVRIRPLQENEKQKVRTRRQTMLQTASESDQNRAISVLDNIILFDSKKTADSKRQYAFDKVLGEDSAQLQVFEATTKPLIKHVLNGYNATVFAYGPTGAGKTFTVTGTEEEPGIIYQTVKEIYAEIDRLSSDFEVETALSYLEVYNETIRDLFTTSSHTLDIREDDTKVVVAGLNEIIPRNLDHVMKLLLQGNENRTKAFTHANAASSRSHAVLQIHLRQKSKLSFGEDSIKVATLNIIDLAGSERASATQNKGERLHEGANINRSLLALGNCINALCSDKPTHIPFRDSKLTRLLKHSLSGNCRVVMIANISPAMQHSEETLNTLKYANRAKDIKTKVSQNIVNVSTHIAQYPQLVESLREEINSLKSKLARPTGEEIMDESIKLAIKHCKKYQDKILQKQITISTNQREMSFNELIANQIRSILLSITNCVEFEKRRLLNDSILRLNQGLDNIHCVTVALTHNITEATRSIEKYKERLEKAMQIEIPSQLQQTITNLLDRLQFEREAAFFAHEQPALVTFQKDWNEKISKLFQWNLTMFQASLSPSNIDDLVTALQNYAQSFVSELTKFDNESIEISYETCTEDNFSDCTFTEQVSRMEVVDEALRTPRKHHFGLDDIDMDATPVAKRMKTPKQLTARKKLKTPRRKPRMSMIPVFSSKVSLLKE